MTDTLRPGDVAELCDVIARASAQGRTLRLRGGGSKDDVGAPTPAAQIVDLRGFCGIVEYDPPELVLTARAGTPLAEVEALVATEGQMLAFDPVDLGSSTIGGVIAAGVAGSARLTRGGARDHLLGFEAVSGRGERFVAGGKVVKNVTGFDLPKVMAGSWGRLAALTEVTLKVMPRPQMQKTLVLRGLDPAAAVTAMARALGTPAEVSAAAHLPAWAGAPVTALRLDGFESSIAARCAMLRTGWDAMGHVSPLTHEKPLWRVVVAPSCAPAVIAKLAEAEWILDWAGGLLWLATEAEPTRIRAAAQAAGGHAALHRGDPALRSYVAALHPATPTLAALEVRVRRAFDPVGVFETGRF
jgi:glycolate oxidase FAD binding subunit